MSEKVVIFDLDGTLIDSLRDLAESMNLALQEHGLSPHPLEAYKTMVGDGMQTLVMRASGSQDLHLIQPIVESMKKIYSDNWAIYTKPYTGILELLLKLQDQQVSMNILSNKPDLFTKEISAHFFTEFKFDTVLGASEQFPKKPAPDSAKYIAKQYDCDLNQIYYLGDTDTDMKTATGAGLRAIGVAWGFRSRDELLKHGAEVVIEDPAELIDFMGL